MSHSGFIENHHGNQRPLRNLPLCGRTRRDRGGDPEERGETGGVMAFRPEAERSRRSGMEVRAEEGATLQIRCPIHGADVLKETD